jgi:hypothetical protein
VRTVTRIDVVDLAAPVITLEGFLSAECKAARVGVQDYINPDGSTRRELRLPEDVFDAASMATYRLRPMTNTHPIDLVNSDNAGEHVIGSVGDARKFDDTWIALPVMIYDGKAVADAKAGRSQISVGYTCAVIDEAGEHPQYGRFDSRQTAIRVNHVALVDAARAGPQARLRLDSTGNAVLASESSTPSRVEKPMPKTIRVDAATFPANDDNADAIQLAIDGAAKAAGERLAAELTRADKAETDRKALESERDTLRADRDAAKKRADEGEEAAAKPMMKCDKCVDGTGKMADGAECDKCMGKGEVPRMDKGGKVRAWIDAAIERRAGARAKLLEEAGPHLPEDFKADGKPDLEIKRAVVETLDGVKMDSEPALYIERRYAIALAEAAKRGDAAPVDGVRPPVIPRPAPRKDGNTRQREAVFYKPPTA